MSPSPSCRQGRYPCHARHSHSSSKLYAFEFSQWPIRPFWIAIFLNWEMSIRMRATYYTKEYAILPAAPWKVAFAIINTPSWLKISSAKVCPISGEFVSTRVKKRLTSCFTSGEGWKIGQIAEFVELFVAIVRMMKWDLCRRRSLSGHSD